MGSMEADGQKLPSNRSFAAVFVVFFLVIGARHWYTAGPTAATWFYLACAGATGFVGVFAPARLTPLNRAWMRFGLLLNRVVSPIVLGVLYLTLFVPVGLVMRLVGRDALHLRRDPAAVSYWQARAGGRVEPAQFEDQF